LVNENRIDDCFNIYNVEYQKRSNHLHESVERLKDIEKYAYVYKLAQGHNNVQFINENLLMSYFSCRGLNNTEYNNFVLDLGY
jgi:hypothetical protein